MVSEGRPAPDFTLTSDSGVSVTLSQFRGAPVVLSFDPKDDTPVADRSTRSIVGAFDVGRPIRLHSCRPI